MTATPAGTVTFLFTDIEGSTQRWEKHHAAMALALLRHDALLGGAIRARGGHIFKTIGDAFQVAFANPIDAILAAAEAQRTLAAEDWSACGPDFPALRVRMALHIGLAAPETDGDYRTPLLNRVARLMSAGHGGQVLLSTALWETVRDNLPDGVSLRDLGERRLKDLRRPERVFQVLVPDLLSDFPPLATLDARPNNLPVQLTSFVGREREMAEVKRMLGASHLVTLTGIGGTGKTRLALQAAADLIDDFDHGVWFVDLAPLTDPALVASTVATVLGVEEEPGRPIEATLADNLKAKRLLVVLDNCEHLVAACAELAESLLRAAPGLRILATSREALAIAGEAACPIAPLPLPPLAANGRPDTSDLAVLYQCEAVRLFIDRAVSAVPSFQVTNANAPAVAQICHRLDGIPLAIELAAARVRALAPDQIAARLDDRFRLLTGGRRTALPRQQTLHAAIEWSYDLLTESERVLFRRLAVFQGGWTLDAAEGVCAGGGLDEVEILDLLTHLVEKSLIEADMEDATPRYRFLETIREYAAERLAMTDEIDALRDWHLGWYVRFVAGFDPSAGNPDIVEWTDRLEREHDNLRTALSWGLADSSRVEQAMALIHPLFALWDGHGHFREGLDWYALTSRLALQLGLDVTHPDHFGWVSFGLAYLSSRTGALDFATVCAERAQQCFERSGERRGFAWALNTLALVATNRGDFIRAEELLIDSLALHKELGVAPGEIAAVINYLGEVERARGNFPQAFIYYRDCLAMNPDAGWIHHNLGHVLLRLGEVAEAETFFGHSLTNARQFGNPIWLASTLGGIAGIADARRQPQRAARLFGAGEMLIERCGGVLEPADQADWDHNLAAARGQLDGAVWQAARAEGAAMTEDEAVAYARGEIDPWGEGEEYGGLTM